MKLNKRNDDWRFHEFINSSLFTQGRKPKAEKGDSEELKLFMAFVFKRRKNLIHFIDSMASQVKGGFPLILGALSPAQKRRNIVGQQLPTIGSCNCTNCDHCDDHFFIFISFPQFIYDLFHTSLTLISFTGTYEPTIDLLPTSVAS